MENLLFGHKKLALEAAPFSAQMLQWYDTNARNLPWRSMPSLYRTVVSEFMCQQTQIATVLPYFARWMERFPDFKRLAEAEENEVVKYWEGLGYYTRARNLHKLARTICQLDSIPRDRQSWLKFPGIGPYTSAAITSISFNQPEAVVDGNVIRILSRLTGDATPFASGAIAMQHLTPLADLLVPDQRPGDHNQAMMELGATLCTKHNPLCTVCPVVTFCVAGKRGDAHKLPNLQKRKTENITIDRGIIKQGNKILIHRIAQNARRLSGMVEFPALEAIGQSPIDEPLFEKKRSISNQRITERFYRSTYTSENPPVDHEWVLLDDLDTLTLSGPHRKWFPHILKKLED